MHALALAIGLLCPALGPEINVAGPAFHALLYSQHTQNGMTLHDAFCVPDGLVLPHGQPRSGTRKATVTVHDALLLLHTP